ncbi:L-type lectin-domain containing receptor kinase IX.1 [Prunus yedoensis var. nudiflora]|uniref:L-type lectin-domain containing receptor kinase IX.1 n=2 Tax=Prunus yedoensis var. nudiflora TaxID=2094558 RepID=A0A314UBA4_PRUYE|nr:L-type lectin-domain containing receptor kinase IX.1 [Prunus yedoensis var. nudiflora]
MVVLLLLLLFHLAPSATSLNFSFPTFPNGINTLSLEGNAFVDGKFLRLTNSAVDEEKTGSVGRATYSQPFLLRDNATGKLADFTTTFTFTIDSRNKTPYADGLAFFLAPNGSALNKSPISTGGALGLPVANPELPGIKPEKNESFVAVEFDIVQNTATSVQDPAGEHVGIDVNSVNSKVTRAWNGSITQGRENSAWIRYDSGSKNLSGWVIVGFSAATGGWTALHKINSWSFNSTSLIDENANNNTPVAPAPTPIVEPESGNGINIGLVVGLVVGGCVLLVGGFCLVWFIFWKKGGTGESSDNDEDPMINNPIDDEFEKGTGPKKFSYKTLAQSTNNFDEGEKLGEGGFGGVYRGFIPDLNSYVAVKRVSSSSKQGPKEYASEVKIISRLRHRNLVQLIGWCHERKFLLVYEFMPNGSLDSHLFKEQSLLTWEARYKIAQGLASGLFYLHEEWEQCVLHRDIKSSNVMLDSNFNAKLGDFGLARLVDHGKQSQTTILAGTMGYMAPDYLNTGKASKESDVYSFGVVALEIACGRKPIDPKFGSSKVNMVEWVWELYGEDRVNEAADPKLCGDFDKKQMECLMIVGLWCAHPDYNMRPSIQQAIQVLNFEVPLPNLPSKMPVATYFAPPKSLSMMSRDTSGSQGGQTESSGYGYNTNSSQFSASSSTTNSHPKISLG